MVLLSVWWLCVKLTVTVVFILRARHFNTSIKCDCVLLAVSENKTLTPNILIMRNEILHRTEEGRRHVLFWLDQNVHNSQPTAIIPQTKSLNFKLYFFFFRFLLIVWLFSVCVPLGFLSVSWSPRVVQIENFLNQIILFYSHQKHRSPMHCTNKRVYSRNPQRHYLILRPILWMTFTSWLC